MNRTRRIGFCLGIFFGLAGAGLTAEPRTIIPQVIDEPVWTYPLAADRAGVRQGDAHAMLSLSATGELLDFLVVSASHPAFAEALATALPEYRFAPARVRGEPRAARFPVTFHFEKGGSLGSLQFDEPFARVTGPRGANDTSLSLVCPPELLDRPLTPTHVVEPRYPDELRVEGSTGEVRVEFFVDAGGRVRLPAVEPQAHPSFAREATAALLEWRFEPPTRGGKPTLVKAEQVFRFPAPPPERKREP